MEFLTRQNRVNAGDKVEDYISAKDKDVVVLGGGDTGSDCVGTSIRQGAKSVTQIELLPKPPDVMKKEPKENGASTQLHLKEMRTVKLRL